MDYNLHQETSIKNMRNSTIREIKMSTYRKQIKHKPKNNVTELIRLLKIMRNDCRKSNGLVRGCINCKYDDICNFFYDAPESFNFDNINERN